MPPFFITQPKILEAFEKQGSTKLEEFIYTYD